MTKPEFIKQEVLKNYPYLRNASEQQIKDALSGCFSVEVEIDEIGFFSENDFDNGFLEDTILFSVFCKDDKKAWVEVEVQEIFVYRIDWEEMRIQCDISVKDCESLVKQKQTRPIEYITGPHSSIKKARYGGYVEVIDTVKPPNPLPKKKDQK
ncbi:hypothetical protein [Aquimarina algiphila]|uniref:Uncharacterized protein n=1 Tax=Aquimarina algiphila TaxID=2047982 RepID=A0A554VIG9_9FLAO|nr:hypothetical protein [Aquimarina algiphila]TSE07422.1 hypothetical protein FOF46_16020 [Aquimarina algiphila]